MQKLIDHSYLIVTILLAGVSQIIVRWQMGQMGPIPAPFSGKLLFVFHFLLRPWVYVSIAATFCSGVCWLITLSKFELSYAYPWTSLLYVYLLVAGLVFFGDTLTFNKVFGTAIIILGVYFIAKG
jgi:multidrug transporter EmrE-like cation transporter